MFIIFNGTLQVEEISKKEAKRRAKAAAKAKATIDPTKPVHENVVGAVDYSKDFFGKRVNLTVSGQLNVETHACALSDVYTFGPTFRAENSHTGRHLAEFWMIEPEICFADLADDINLAEDYLKYCVRFALENCADDLEFFENNPHGEVGLRDRLKNVLDNPFKVRWRNGVSLVLWKHWNIFVMTKKTQWESLRNYSMTIMHKSSFNSTEQSVSSFPIPLSRSIQYDLHFWKKRRLK